MHRLRSLSPVVVILISLCLSAWSGVMAQEAEPAPVFPAPGLVTVVDIGI